MQTHCDSCEHLASIFIQDIGAFCFCCVGAAIGETDEVLTHLVDRLATSIAASIVVMEIPEVSIEQLRRVESSPWN
jgi:hypothetical protein